MKKLVGLLLLSAAALSMEATAHGTAKPQHGGIVAAASDVSFELTTAGDSATLYLIDHDDPMDTSKMSGRLTVLLGSEKSEADLKPAGGNKLTAAPLKLGPGAKLVAVVNGVTGKPVTVRFALKSK